MLDYLNSTRSSRGFELKADSLGELRRRSSRSQMEHYPDTGCHLSPSCLSCPLEVCIHDQERQPPRIDPVQLARERRSRNRMARQVARFMDRGLGRKQAVQASALLSGVSESTVYRALRQINGEG